MSFVKGLAGIGLAAIAASTCIEGALAASPAYCALYAREYALQFVEPATPPAAATQHVQDQAYYRCLNLDENPEFPMTSAYFGADDEDLLSGGVMLTVAEGDAAFDDEADATDTSVPAAATTSTRTASAAKPRRKGRGSGLDPWTPEWIDWCEANYRSFDPQTGYVKTHSGTRKLCP